VVTLGVDQLGGTNAVSACAIEALSARYRVTVLTWMPQEPARADFLFGTNLQALDLAWVCVPTLWRTLVDHLPVSHYLLRLHGIMRLARSRVADYDLVVSTHNEMTFARPCLQYVHFPWSYHPRPDCTPEWYSHPLKRNLMRCYYRLCARLSGFDQTRLPANVSLVNSHWTAERLRACGVVDSEVLNPPVIGKFRPVPWSDREPSFICVGRFAEEKRIERMIRIVERVRDHYPNCRLHMIGGFEPEQPAYTTLLLDQMKSRPWVVVHEKLSRPDLLDLLTSQRYGLHAMEGEHFGMAVAEMVTAGCIPFVPRSGGPPEIVGYEETLLYADEREAVNKILGVLKSCSEQERLRAALDLQKDQYSEKSFRRQFLRAAERVRA
jgi:glycosyltransferase involved in cell wall biosynthesis